MEGGTSGGGTDTVNPPPPPPLPPPISDGGDGAVGEIVVENQNEQQKQEEEQRQEEEEGGADGSEEREEDGEQQEERDKGFDQFDDLQIEEGDGDADRPKLPQGFYEIEAVRKKRTRKGEPQYLIKWRGWPETANTWEPLENLMTCSDIIDAFEESLGSGKYRSPRGRKRKYGGGSGTHTHTHTHTHTLSKKKQQTSPAAAVKVRIVEEPLPMAHLDNEGERYVGGVKDVEMEKRARENGFGKVSAQSEGTNKQNDLNVKVRELRGTMLTNEENMDMVAKRFQEAHALERDGPANRLSKVDDGEQGQPGRCTGARRRKSGSVKRFKQESASCVPCDAQNAVARTTNGTSGMVGWQGSQHPDFVGNGLGHRDKFDISKSMFTITEIIKPISCSSSVINDAPDVSVTFMAMRSDGTEVVVDNKFLKANNPLLLINFYEQHLRYNASSP